jgi:ring-1,2-phenylacetyl-CoA epoxidase subunit PaaE
MSTPKFHALRISDITQETSDCVSIAFAIPAKLQANFTYAAGQYITLKKDIDNGQEARRSYSICSAPIDNELRVAVKKVPNGLFSTYLNEIAKVGDLIDVMEPMGHFTPSIMDDGKYYFGFASGSGITPILSILKSVLAAHPNNKFTLIYGNKNLASIIFKETIEGLKNIYMNRLQVVHILSRERLEVDLNYGRINGAKCTDLFNKVLDVTLLDEAFLCGPEEMIHEVKDYLAAQGIAKDKIKFELFGTNIKKGKVVDEAIVPTGPISKVSVKVDDRTFEMDLAYDGENILDAALKSGADLPFACKGGVCCTCRAKVVSGTVKMNVNYALEDEEVAQGFVLTCQAHPTSEQVVVDFDVR